MRSLRYIATAVILKLALSAALIAQTASTAPAGSLEDLQIAAPSLTGNLVGDPAMQHVFVYLPPSYSRETSRRYAVLYLLHGYSGRPEEWVKDGYQGMSFPAEMDTLVAKGTAAEMIVVVPNGRNAYLGSFYTNSIAGGNWEDYIYRDTVSYVDAHYRTLARPSSRGIAGHSMGGYGAFMLAMKHPDVFGAVYALSPCCLGLEGDITADNAVWAKAAKASGRDVFANKPATFDEFWIDAMLAVSLAFSPNKDRGPLFVDLPYVEREGLLVKSEPAYTSFRSKMPLYLIEQYRTNLMKLRGIFLDVGEIDEFTHIRRATALLSAELSSREIPHAFEIYRGGTHGNKIRERFETRVIPFFTSVLEK